MRECCVCVYWSSDFFAEVFTTRDGCQASIPSDLLVYYIPKVFTSISFHPVRKCVCGIDEQVLVDTTYCIISAFGQCSSDIGCIKHLVPATTHSCAWGDIECMHSWAWGEIGCMKHLVPTTTHSWAWDDIGCMKHLVPTTTHSLAWGEIETLGSCRYTWLSQEWHWVYETLGSCNHTQL